MAQCFDHAGVKIAFIDEGARAARPVLLVHGFGSTHAVNWVGTGWVSTLIGAGYRVIAFDNRGHGASTKLYDPADYATSLMAADAAALLDHLGIAEAGLIGYSMGARITAVLALSRPRLVRSLVLGGLGIHLVDGGGLPSSIASAPRRRETCARADRLRPRASAPQAPPQSFVLTDPARPQDECRSRQGSRRAPAADGQQPEWS